MGVPEQNKNYRMPLVEEHDPGSGMMVDPSKAATSIEHQGTSFNFCSESCAAKFRAAPEKYALFKPVEAPVAIAY